nr:hypothetical protein [uncultured Sphaerochaeta sp.]
MSAIINGITVLTPEDLKKISQILPQVTATDNMLLVVEQTNGTGANTSVGSIRASLVPLTQKGASNGVATLGSDGKIPASQIPALALVSVFTVASEAEMLALTAEQGDMAIRTDTNMSYILSQSPSTTLENWIELAGLSALIQAHAGRTDNPHSVTKEQVGLGSVDNTPDADKPVSGPQQEALDLKLNKADVEDNYDGGATKALSAEKGKDLNTRVSVLEGRKYGLYGFKKHKLTGNCLPLYDSVDLGPIPVIRGSRDVGFTNPYKDIRIFHWRSCLMDTKQNVLAYYGQAGYDTPTHDSQSYEAEIPKAYIKVWEDEFYTYKVVSEVPQLDGMFVPGAFRDNLGREMPFAYVDKYRRGVLNGYSVSRPDVLPEVSITLNAAELKAEAVDTTMLWTGNPEELDWYITFVGEIMACNTDSQAAYGQGMSSMPYSSSHTVVTATTDANTVIVSNATADAFKPSINVKLGSALGSGQSFDDRTIQSITDNGDGTSTIVVDGAPFSTVVGYILHAHRQVTTSYEAEQIGEDCGFILHNGRPETQVENWINGIAGHGGNVYEFSFGLLRYDNYVYLCHDRYQFGHNDDPRNNPAYKNVGFFEQTDGGTYGWIKNMALVGEDPYVIEWVSELGASDITHYADRAYYLAPDWRGTRIVLRRFFWNSGSYCGRRSLHGNYDLSFSLWRIGWRASPSKLPKQVS